MKTIEHTIIFFLLKLYNSKSINPHSRKVPRVVHYQNNSLQNITNLVSKVAILITLTHKVSDES